MDERFYNEIIKSSKTRTYTGKWVDALNFDHKLVDIVDIAHALSMNCRFNGHLKTFYSVAQHSLWVCEHLPDELKLCGLMHDAPEAYIADVPKPFKDSMPEYRRIEYNLMKEIAKIDERIIFPFPDIVKEVDMLALEYEWWNLMMANNVEFVNPKIIEEKFIKTYFELTK